MKLSARRIRKQKGNAFLEFGIVCIFMVPVFFGVIDYSRVFYYAAVVQGAARAGTQYAVYEAPNHSNTSGVQAAATADTANVPSVQSFSATPSVWCQCANASSITSTVSCSGSCGTGVNMYVYSQVNTQLTFNTFFKYPLLPTSITVNGKSIMRVQ